MYKFTIVLIVLIVMLLAVTSVRAQEDTEDQPLGTLADVAEVEDAPEDDFGYTDLFVWIGSLFVTLALAPALGSAALQGAKKAVMKLINGTALPFVNYVLGRTGNRVVTYENSGLEIFAVWATLIYAAIHAVGEGYSIFAGASPEVANMLSHQGNEIVSAIALIGSMQLFHHAFLQGELGSKPVPKPPTLPE